MEMLEIELLNPKAKNILKDLASLNIIKIKKYDYKNNFKKILNTTRKYSNMINFEEITNEVIKERSKRYSVK